MGVEELPRPQIQVLRPDRERDRASFREIQLFEVEVDAADDVVGECIAQDRVPGTGIQGLPYSVER
ncbi:MAG: hypothetical protein APR53_09435 [Methanoculleus sp. SDB]|nr:MAG: hypothetical protein APR53_09435 [Methanoculleus sp. SDB]